ncbi:MAG: hypothetical protein AAGD01_06320 [Acidobacteriota bacterium]
MTRLIVWRLSCGGRSRTGLPHSSSASPRSLPAGRTAPRCNDHGASER